MEGANAGWRFSTGTMDNSKSYWNQPGLDSQYDTENNKVSTNPTLSELSLGIDGVSADNSWGDVTSTVAIDGSRLIGATENNAGTCTVCAANTYAADDATDCQANTVCGKQLGGTVRLTGASRTVAGSCAACAANTYAAEDATDCTTTVSPSPSSTGEEDLNLDSDQNSAMKSNQNTAAPWSILFITCTMLAIVHFQ